MVKERISLTIEKDILEKVDQRVNGVNFRSRSHIIEYLLSKALGTMKINKALILAGGKGTRLRPITYELPKPMISVKGKPILEHQIELLRKYDIRDIVISIGYLGDKIKEYFGNGSRFGVKITYVEESESMGTGGPLRLAKHLLNETFVMTNGDNLIDIDLDEMYNFHKENKAEATVALTSVQDPSQYGVIVLEGAKILEFVEKPKKGEAPSNIINAGLYIIEPEVTESVEDGEVSIEKDIFPKIADKGKLFGFSFSGDWFSTDNQERYEIAIKGWQGIR